jgi:hypothetical protein
LKLELDEIFLERKKIEE